MHQLRVVFAGVFRDVDIGSGNIDGSEEEDDAECLEVHLEDDLGCG